MAPALASPVDAGNLRASINARLDIYVPACDVAYRQIHRPTVAEIEIRQATTVGRNNEIFVIQGTLHA